jgi:hypothetical protein
MKAIKQVCRYSVECREEALSGTPRTHSFTSWVKHYVANYQETKGGCHDR